MNHPISLKTAAAAYLKSLESSGKSTRTLYTYGKDLEQVKNFFGPERLLPSILKVQVGKFYKSPELLQKPDRTTRAKASLTKTIRVFRMFMLWAYQEGYIQALPLTKDTPMGRSQTLPLTAKSDSPELSSQNQSEGE